MLNIRDFKFFMWKLQPPEKSHPLFSRNPLLNLRSCQTPSSPFWKFVICLEVQPPSHPQQKGGGGCILCIVRSILRKNDVQVTETLAYGKNYSKSINTTLTFKDMVDALGTSRYPIFFGISFSKALIRNMTNR